MSSRAVGRDALRDALRALLHACHLLAPDDLPVVVADCAARMGVRETVLYLADYEQVTLVPVPGTGVPERSELAIEGTLAGRAFRRVEVVVPSSPTADVHRMWFPLLDGVERFGVVEMVLSAAPDPEHEARIRAFVTLVAELLAVRDAYGDVFSRIRRRRPLTLAAEMQWELLPPLTFGSERVVITEIGRAHV